MEGAESRRESGRGEGTNRTDRTRCWTLPCPSLSWHAVQVTTPVQDPAAFLARWHYLGLFAVIFAEEAGVPLPIPGDLFIGGVGVAKGYWRDPERTVAAVMRAPVEVRPDDSVEKALRLAAATELDCLLVTEAGKLAGVRPDDLAAEVIAGLKRYFDPQCIPSVAYTDPEVAWVGMTENEAKAKGIQYGKGTFPWAAR